MKAQTEGWDYLNDLGRQYYEQVGAGYGIPMRRFGGRNSHNPFRWKIERTAEQVRIINEIVEKTRPYLYKLAFGLRNGKYPEFTSKNGKKFFYFPKSSLTIDDLVQVGAERLIQSFHNYDPNKGKVSTFISYTAIAEMRRKMNDEGNVIRVPINTVDKIRAAVSGCESLEEAMACFEEAGRGRWSLAVLFLALGADPYININEPVGEKGSGSASNSFEQIYLVDEKNPTPEEAGAYLLLRDKVEELLGCLTKREARIIRLRYGMEGGDKMTLQDIGHIFGVTRERIRQVQQKAEEKLRQQADCLEAYL